MYESYTLTLDERGEGGYVKIKFLLTKGGVGVKNIQF